MRAILDGANTMTAPERLVALAILRHADDDGVAWPGLHQLAKATGLSRATVIRRLRSLEKREGGPVAIRHDRRKVHGRLENDSNRYVVTFLGSVTTTPPSVTVSTGSVAETLGVVSPRHYGSVTVSRDLPIELPNQLPRQLDLAAPSAPAVRGGFSKVKKTKSEQTPEGHAETVATYFECFEQARGEKPPFGSREGKAVSTLIAKLHGAEPAQRAIRNVYAGFFAKTASIVTIADDPARFVGNTNGQRQNGQHLVQGAARPGEYDWTASLAADVKS